MRYFKSIMQLSLIIGCGCHIQIWSYFFSQLRCLCTTQMLCVGSGGGTGDLQQGLACPMDRVWALAVSRRPAAYILLLWPCEIYSCINQTYLLHKSTNINVNTLFYILSGLSVFMLPIMLLYATILIQIYHLDVLLEHLG